MSDARRVVVAVARSSMLVAGVLLTTLSFVRMVEGDKAPWWWIGLIGVTATVVGLGAPWSARRPDAES